MPHSSDYIFNLTVDKIANFSKRLIAKFSFLFLALKHDILYHHYCLSICSNLNSVISHVFVYQAWTSINIQTM